MQKIIASVATTLFLSACSFNTGDGNNSAEVSAESGDAAQAKVDALQPGDYRFERNPSQVRFNTTSASTLAEICPAATRRTVGITGDIEAASSFMLTDYSDIVANNGAKFGRPSVDSEGVCRVAVQFSGIANGNSVSFDKVCRVVTIQIVEEEGKRLAALKSVDPFDCVG